MSDTGKTIALIKALAPAPEIDPEQVKQDVEDWLDDHPEATTTVEDGAITKAKLNASLQGTVDDVDTLKSAIDKEVEDRKYQIDEFYQTNLLVDEREVVIGKNSTPNPIYVYFDIVVPDIVPGDTYTLFVKSILNSTSTTTIELASFDSDNTRLNVKYITGTSNIVKEIVPPSGASYIQIRLYPASGTPLTYDAIYQNVQLAHGKAVKKAIKADVDLSLADPNLTRGANVVADLDITDIGDNNPPITDGTETTDFQNATLNNQGGIYYYANEVVSKLVRVNPNCQYKYTGFISGNSSICFYNENKAFISGKSATQWGAQQNIEFTTPDTCFYMRLCCAKSYINDFGLLYLGATQVKNAMPMNMKDGTVAGNKNGINTAIKISDIASYTGEIDPDDDAMLSNVGAVKDSTGITISQGVGEEFAFRSDFIIPDDVHDSSGEYELMKISSGADTVSVRLNKGVTSQNSTYPICPVPVYNAGFSVYYNNTLVEKLTPDGWQKELLLGKDTMAFRFGGDCSQSSNQDIRLSIDSTKIRIYHSTEDATIAEYAKSTYTTVKSLYNALLSLTGFEVEMLDIEDISTDDLIACDVPLVSEYYTNNAKTTSAWDAFPFYFTTKPKNQHYNIEVLINNNINVKTQVLLNGYCLWMRGQGTNLFANRQVEFKINELGGATIATIQMNKEAKSIYPSIRVFYAEGITEGTTGTSGDLAQSRLAGLISLMEKYGYSYETIDDLEKILDGSIKPDNDFIWHFAHDDSAFEVVTNTSIRNTFLSHGVRPSVAVMMSADETDTVKKLVRASMATGFGWYIHSGIVKPAVGIGYYSYSELSSDVQNSINKFVDEFGAIPTIWDFHLTTENYNVVRYLKNHGFTIIFGGNATGCLNSINRYHCQRFPMYDALEYSYIEPFLNNYYNEY